MKGGKGGKVCLFSSASGGFLDWDYHGCINGGARGREEGGFNFVGAGEGCMGRGVHGGQGLHAEQRKQRIKVQKSQECRNVGVVRLEDEPSKIGLESLLIYFFFPRGVVGRRG